MLEIKGLSKTYGTNIAVDSLSFTVSPGEVFGLLGRNGAGKTTLVRHLLEHAEHLGMVGHRVKIEWRDDLDLGAVAAAGDRLSLRPGIGVGGRCPAAVGECVER